MKLNIDTTTVELDNFEPLPENWYPCQVESQEEKTTKNGGVVLSYKLRIIGDNYRNRVVFASYNVVCPSSPKAEQIARSLLAKLAKACGIANLGDSSELIYKTCRIHVTIEEYDGKKRNKVNGYEVYSEGSSGVQIPAAEKQWYER